MIQARAHTRTYTRTYTRAAANDDDYADLMYMHILHSNTC